MISSNALKLIQKAFRLGLSLAVSLTLLTCGSPSVEDENNNERLRQLVNSFSGLIELVKQGDRSWILRWDPIDFNGVIYAIYKAKKEEKFDFDSPMITTNETLYHYFPDNIFVESNTCFIVRVITGGFDANEINLCTDDEPIEFSGLTEMERLGNGTYILKWNEIPVKGIVYSIFEKVDDGEYDFDIPSYDGIRESFFKTSLYPRGEIHCFVVRYYHADLTADQNLSEFCTDAEIPLEFQGITNITIVSSTAVKVHWPISDLAEVVGYQVYLGSDFNELAASAEKDVDNILIDGLAPGRQYSFGVAAVDSFGRIDGNLKILSVVTPLE